MYIFGLVWIHLVEFDLDWFGFVLSGLVWSDLVWSGVVWLIGFVWLVLASIKGLETDTQQHTMTD